MPTIGQRLKAAREERHLTLEQAFEATRIRVAYLKALEEDDLSVMPSPVQARGYLRNYAVYLGLDLDRLLEAARASQHTTEEILGPADVSAQQVPSTLSADVSLQQPPPSPPLGDSAQESESTLEPPPARSKRRTRTRVETSVETSPKKTSRKRNKIETAPVVETRSEVAEVPPTQTEPIFDQEEKPEEALPVNVSDGLWQTWLDRIGSVLSARSKRGEAHVEINGSPLNVEAPQPQTGKEPSTLEPSQPANPQPESVQTSAQIFKEIGAQLRERRENLSLHLEEVERNTKVKAHYLEALEQGAMHKLPSPVQTRGMLSNYAFFLDMDVDSILLRYADALQASHRERNPQRPTPKPGQSIAANLPALRSLIAGDMIFGIGMAVLLVGFVFWGINRVLILQSLREVQPTAPSISDVLLASPDLSPFTATATFPPVEAFADEATPTIIIPTINVNIRVQVNLIAVERTYARVIADGKVVFDGRVVPGNAYLYEAEEQVEVLAGSGAAIRIAYNGRDLGLMGAFGQVVNNIYRANEIVTPTALPSSTPVNTPTPSPTLRPTNTPVVSQTPVPTRTPVP